jgi:hypothetical protein
VAALSRAGNRSAEAEMEEFRGKPEQYERLKTALKQLYEGGIKSAEIEVMAEKEAKRLGLGDWMTRTDMDKFRSGVVAKPRGFLRAVPVWNVVFSTRYHFPTADGSEPPPPDAVLQDAPGPHGFFHSSVKFFDVHQHRQTRAKKGLLGRFAFYHFSEYFHKFGSVQRAVVVGQWDIDLTDGAYCVEEKQEYHGTLGKPPMLDSYTGYCLPKGPNVCLILREVHKETPKFYMLEALHDHPETRQTEMLAGYMLKGSFRHKFYHSPVYAVRVPREKPVECNILRCEDVPAHVMVELEELSNR